MKLIRTTFALLAALTVGSAAAASAKAPTQSVTWYQEDKRAEAHPTRNELAFLEVSQTPKGTFFQLFVEVDGKRVEALPRYKGTFPKSGQGFEVSFGNPKSLHWEGGYMDAKQFALYLYTIVPHGEQLGMLFKKNAGDGRSPWFAR